MARPYERLSLVYDSGWCDFSLQYVDWINEILAGRGIPRGSILDLACGTGTLAIELGRLGHTVCGIDISAEMIQKAVTRSTGLPNVSFVIQDMARLKMNRKFQLAACTFDSINYLLRPGQVGKMLSATASLLDRGGIFIFDSNTKQLYKSHSGETTKMELQGQEFLQHCQYDDVRRRAITTFSFSNGTYEVHHQRPYDYDDLSPLLEKAGFRVLNLYSWFDMIPYSPNTAKLFCIAEKC